MGRGATVASALAGLEPAPPIGSAAAVRPSSRAAGRIPGTRTLRVVDGDATDRLAGTLTVLLDPNRLRPPPRPPRASALAVVIVTRAMLVSAMVRTRDMVHPPIGAVSREQVSTPLEYVVNDPLSSHRESSLPVLRGGTHSLRGGNTELGKALPPMPERDGSRV